MQRRRPAYAVLDTSSVAVQHAGVTEPPAETRFRAALHAGTADFYDHFRPA